MANDFAAHPQGHAPDPGVASGTQHIPSAPATVAPPSHPEIR